MFIWFRRRFWIMESFFKSFIFWIWMILLRCISILLVGLISGIVRVFLWRVSIFVLFRMSLLVFVVRLFRGIFFWLCRVGSWF